MKLRTIACLIGALAISSAPFVLAVTGGGLPSSPTFLSARFGTGLSAVSSGQVTIGQGLGVGGGGTGTWDGFPGDINASGTITGGSITSNGGISSTTGISAGTTLSAGSTITGTTITGSGGVNATGGSFAASGTTGVRIAGAAPGIQWGNSTGGADGKLWDCHTATPTDFICRLVNDANSSSTSWLDVTRSGMTVTSVNFPNGTLQTGGVAVTTQSTTTATGTATGCTAALTTTFRYVKTGNSVVVGIDQFSCTSNATSFTFTGAVPAAMQPARTVECLILGFDNANNQPIVVQFASGSTTASMFTSTSGTGLWTAANGKGIAFANNSCSYLLN